MSIKARLRKLRAEIQEATAAQRTAQVRAWFTTVSDEDLFRLVAHRNALRQSTGDPERTLTWEDTAGVLGKSVETLEAEIRAAGGAS